MAEAASTYTDKTLACKDCGSDWVFSTGEQEFYAGKGFENEPARCKECRKKKKIARYRKNRAAKKTGDGSAPAAPGVCYSFQKGDCTRGESCRFAHTLSDSA